MTHILDLRDISLIRQSKPIIKDLSWKVSPGQRWVILGPNGAGKTTLLRIAGAEEFPTRGSVRILDEQVGRTDMRDLRSMIGFSSPSLATRIPHDENVIDLVVSAGYAIVGRWREEYDEHDIARAQALLERMGAGHLADRRFGYLSEGERKRVLIARALMTDPELLLLDEPTAGLDLGGREDLMGYLGAIARDEDAPVLVMITHHVEEIPAGFSHALLLDQGQIVTQGPIADVVTSENLSKLYDQPLVVDEIDGRYFARRQE
ncbi:ABC transporter ATP-binding protein [Corynebacterium sp. ES2794-CONJ1]|uniref:ABC transporter ATP-binding protein n=1 Tax=unclassified Corynebacterium TaxID=2624378 RepID=UPI00216966C6|nr:MULTISPECIES: ABC transporter ATP-binding protein [unclassified Corynebacterium]MCS4489809.1 ABC transporter ATP-binding protein [Corynebacterium sp. ES2775-CONJ]MCS4491827.1 ABC transporter ATP-binding protein [Corynebacterium sp. ES2715-CONJ3]MCS4531932.1 ABC transporter ATP-binding protein [Corynebacterium sp. ES2730-CONJ]MCU9519333.1 ABC transporter ATP-binding protein [Corynebacterium sp. ES2794-CONJ1]